jgi:hypothetical protein
MQKKPPVFSESSLYYPTRTRAVNKRSGDTTAKGLHYGVVSLFVVSPGDEALVADFESPGPAAAPGGVPPGGGAFLMTLNASGVSLSDTGPPGGGAFSITLNAGGKGPSDAAGPPGAGAFCWALKASGSADCAAAEPGGCDAVPP